jgi:hypothetical protein
MANRRQFLQGAAVAAVPMVAGLSAQARVPDDEVTGLHAVLIDPAYAESRSFGARLAARGEVVRAVPDSDITSLWLTDIGPAWRRSPVCIAGLTRPAALFCLEQLSWAKGLRVVFHAEHVLSRDCAVSHTVHHCASGPTDLGTGDLSMRGPLWPAQVADLIACQVNLRRPIASGPSCAGLAPPMPPDTRLLTSWIIAPA